MVLFSYMDIQGIPIHSRVFLGPMAGVTVTVTQGGQVIGMKKMRKALPAEMIRIEARPAAGGGEVEVSACEDRSDLHTLS